ncbi:MAG TPA: LpqB family beta-propeller domain-containing protein [Actinomycetes bacterium]
MDSRCRARLLRPIVALAALLGLTACTAGVPKTGEVVSVSPVTTTSLSAGPESQEVGDPSSGQSESEVAVGFMNAMNTGDVSVVQRWVMPQARDQVSRWAAATTTVRVYSAFEPGPEYQSGDKRIVPITVKLAGQLRGGRDWYPATGESVLNLELESDGADARVANPGSVIWMRDVNFSKLYTQAEVFMAPDLADPSPQLAPVPVFVPTGAENDPQAPRLRAERALKLLLEGPRGRYDNLSTAIPGGTKLNELRYADDVATVNLSHSFSRPEGPGQVRVGQIVWTVNRLLPSASVRLLVDGRPVRTLGADRFQAGRLWRRRDQPLASMWPRRSPVGRSFEILFVRRGEIWKIPAQPGQSPKVVVLNAPSPKSAPTWSPDHRSMAFLVGTGDSQSLWMQQPSGDDFPVTGAEGRLSPPSWSPDSQRVYVLRRDESGTRLLEAPRSTMTARALDMPPLPSALQPTSIAVSPDGAFVLAVADHPDRKVEDAEHVPGGQLFLGQLGRNGVVSWSTRPIAPGLGRVYNPIWVDPVTVAFVGETDSKDDLGRLWTIKSDGWDPTAVLNDSDVLMGDIGNNLTVDPTGRAFVVTARSGSGGSLWAVNRQDKSAMPLTSPLPNAFDSDPSFASR